MKLLKIESSQIPHASKISKTHWMINSDYEVRMITDEGTLVFRMKAGWITDFRSGSSVVDCIVPKVGNRLYCATILCHDMAYSGHITKALADELLYHGMVLSGQSKFLAGLAYRAVRMFGGTGYYHLDDKMAKPYTRNRILERFEWTS